MLLCKRFNKKYIVQTKKYFFKKNKMKNYQNDFDYFCVGSDQIWNPGVVQNNDFFFLNFAPPEKTFSFAASMGTTYIPEQYKNTYMTGLSKIGFLSVRENDVKEFIQKLINRNSTVLLDPTLLIDKSE
ncbi:MAG: polysaccharide pyruvyl transferase family protein [Ruminococcaceae bacterium]|nr:polysaccharide pyruvyl transferase family protein [Oscillospiraceae bacterium]